MSFFAGNLVLLGAWSLCLRRFGGFSRTAFVVIMTLQLVTINMCSPIVSDAVMYASVAQTRWYGSFEPGWVLLSDVLWSIWPDAKMPMLGVSAMTLASFGRFFLKYSDNLPLSYLVFISTGLWGMTFFIWRQCVAISVILFAYDAICQRRPLRFVPLVVVAGLFHQTAFAFLVAYPLATLPRGNAFRILAEVLGAIVLVFFAQPVFDLLFSIFRNGSLLSTQEDVGGEGWFAMLLMTTACITVFDSKNRDGVFQKMTELATVVQTGSFHFPVFVRLDHYFDLSMTVSLPNALAAMDDRHTRTLATLLVVAALLFFYICIGDWMFPGGAEAFTFTPPFGGA